MPIKAIKTITKAMILSMMGLLEYSYSSSKALRTSLDFSLIMKYKINVAMAKTTRVNSQPINDLIFLVFYITSILFHMISLG